VVTQPETRPLDPQDRCACGHHRYAHSDHGTACGAPGCFCIRPRWEARAEVPAGAKRAGLRLVVLGPLVWALALALLAWQSSAMGGPWWALPLAFLAGGVLIGAVAAAAGILIGLVYVTMERERT